MTEYLEYLKPIDKSYAEMLDLLIDWSNINSHSYNLKGLATIQEKLKAQFIKLAKKYSHLKLDIQEIELAKHLTIDSKANEVELALGKALRIRKLNASPHAHKVLLMGHMDTVYPADSSFQKCTQIDEKTLNGPGVADLKGGLIVMLKAIELLEASPYAQNIQWEVFINPDEEIGSPGSQKLFPELAANNDLALIYEPSLSDGSIAYRRKGTGNFTLVVRGKAAHVGREFKEGASAILAAAEFIHEANQFNSDAITINFGKIEGGGSLNVVPDLAILGINIRVEHSEDAVKIEKSFNKIISKLNSQTHIEAKLYGSLNRKPKIPNEALEQLYKSIAECAAELGQTIQKKDTGGCCDGNNLWEFGLVNIDTMGVRGGQIHSPKEFVCLDSLVERAKLSALFLMKLGAKETL